MNLWKDLEAGEPNKANIVIEIPKGSRNKYEYDKELGIISLDRVLFSSMFYPTDYGFVPGTFYDDDDPLDALFISRYPLNPGTVVKGRLIGGFRMEDEKGLDDKLIFVPLEKIDPYFSNIKTIDDLSKDFKKEIEYFFSRYKDLENKKAEFKGWLYLDESIEIFNKGKELFRKLRK
jgi:inorganic pyrophosphatase